jgi:hypothetical protein
MLALLFLGSRGSVLLAVLCHLGLNTAESVLLNGLPALSPEQICQTNFINVAVLGGIGLGSLWPRGDTHRPRSTKLLPQVPRRAVARKGEAAATTCSTRV